MRRYAAGLDANGLVYDDDGDGYGGANDDDDAPMFKVEPALYLCVPVVEPAGDWCWPVLLYGSIRMPT